MARISKQRGYGFEYKIVNWFNNEEKRNDWPLGWEAERNMLSREEKKFGQTTAKHDVKALKSLPSGAIFLQIEAKKTGKELHTIQKKWIDKIDFHKDELLAIALARTETFVVIDLEAMPKLFNIETSVFTREILPNRTGKKLSCRGSSSVRIHKEDVETATLEKMVLLNWENIGRVFCIFPISEYITLREKRPPNISLQQAAGFKKQAEDTDTPVVEVDIQQEVIITCPRTNLPIKLIPRKARS